MTRIRRRIALSAAPSILSVARVHGHAVSVGRAVGRVEVGQAEAPWDVALSPVPVGIACAGVWVVARPVSRAYHGIRRIGAKADGKLAFAAHIVSWRAVACIEGLTGSVLGAYKWVRRRQTAAHPLVAERAVVVGIARAVVW